MRAIQKSSIVAPHITQMLRAAEAPPAEAPKSGGWGDLVNLGRESVSQMGAFADFAGSSLSDFFGGLMEQAQERVQDMDVNGAGDAALSQLAAPGAETVAPAGADTTAPPAAVEAPQSASSAVVDQLKSTGDDLLSRGSSGPEVKALQEMLEAEGYDLGSAGADGKFGPKTKAAVEAFQRDQAAKAENPDNALKVDGIVGAQTRAALGNERLSKAKEIEETIEKLNEGGPRDGVDALRAEDAKKKGAELSGAGDEAKAQQAATDRGKPEQSSVERAQEADKRSGGEAAKGSEARA